jgi:hypothetical protein
VLHCGISSSLWMGFGVMCSEVRSRFAPMRFALVRSARRAHNVNIPPHGTLTDIPGGVGRGRMTCNVRAIR